MSEIEKSQPIMMLDSEDAWLDSEVKKKVWAGPFDKAIGVIDSIYNWGRRSSIWPMQFGLACCAIEMICAGGGRFDIARFGAELFRPSPRQADLMIVAGTVTKKMVPAIVRLYNQMAEPKYVIAMGACASAGGPFKEGYNVVSGIDKFLPVDVYVPGCPPTPQALLNGLITLQKKIDAQSVRAVPWYQAESHDAIPEPVLGPDIYDPRRAQEIKMLSADPEKLEALYIHIAARSEVKHGKKEGEGEPKAAPAAKPAAAKVTPAPKPAAAAPKAEGATSATSQTTEAAAKATPAAATVKPGATVEPAAQSAAPAANTGAKAETEGTATKPASDAVQPAPGMVSKVESPATEMKQGVEAPKATPIPQPAATKTEVTPHATKEEAGKGGDEINPRTVDVAEPATPEPDASAPIAAGRGEVRPIPANEPDKIMSERTYNPPGQRDPNKPALEGLPSATPQNEAKLEELKADADFAAKVEPVHRELAKGTAVAETEARRIEKEQEAEVAAKLDAREADEGGLRETEPGAGESKEATKKFQSTIAHRETADKQPAQENVLVQPSAIESEVATESFRSDVTEPDESHKENPASEGGTFAEPPQPDQDKPGS